MAGTGYPLPKNDNVRLDPAPVIDGSRLSSADSWMQIARSAERLGDVATDTLQREEQLARAGAWADFQNRHSDIFIKKSQEMRGRPQEFEDWGRAHMDGALSEAPRWMIPQAKLFLGGKLEAGIGSHLEIKRGEDERINRQNLTARLKSVDEDIQGRFANGLHNTPESAAAVSEYDSIVKTLVATKAIAPAEGERLRDESEVKWKGTLIRNDVEGVYKERGFEAARERLETLTKELGASYRVSDRVKAGAMTWLRAEEAVRRQDLQSAREGMREAMFAIDKGVRLDPETLDSITGQLTAAGGFADAARLRAKVARAEQLQEFNRLPLAEQTRQISSLSAGHAAASPNAQTAYQFFIARGYSPAAAAGIVGHGLQESGLRGEAANKGDGRDGSDSIGGFQWNAERAAALRQFAAARGKPATDFQTQLEFVDHELRTSETKAGEALRSAKTPAEAVAAFMHFERPKGYTPDNPTGGYGYRNRVAFAEAVAGRAGVMGPSPGTDLRLFAGQRQAVKDKTTEEWAKVAKDLDAGVRPATSVLDEIIQGAAVSGNHDLLETIGARMDQFEATARAGQAPLNAQEAAAAELRRRGATGDLSPGSAALMKDIERRTAEITKGLEDDPVATTVTNFPDRFRTPPPIDISSSAALRASLAERGKIAQFAAQNWGVPARAALDSADISSLQAALETADARTTARVYGDIAASLPEGVRTATLSKLGQKSPQSMVNAYAGALYTQAPEVSESIIRGQKAVQADERYDPLKGNDKDRYQSELDKRMPPTTFGLTARTSETGAYQTMQKAVLARYADMSAQAGDTSAKLNDERLDKAVADVTGGVLKHNGSTLIAPQRGMTQRQFDQVIWGVTDADLEGVTTMAGQPVTRTYLRSTAKLESVGDGRYMLRLGSDMERPIYAFRDIGVSGGNRMQPFVLDLRGRTPAPNAARPSRSLGIYDAGSAFPRG